MHSDQFYRPLLVTCELAGPIAGAAPMLDGLILDRWCLLRGYSRRVSRSEAIPGVQRHFAADRFPLAHTMVSGLVVPHASSPIASATLSDRHFHYHRRFPTQDAVRLCDDKQLGVISTASEWAKSYRLPLRARVVAMVAWIVEGNRRELLKLLESVGSIGRKRSYGWGMVNRSENCIGWSVDDRPDLAGCWWWAPHVIGPVLMRPLPLTMLGARLDGQAYRRGYSAPSPPYWHPDNHMDTIEPC